MKNEKKKEYGWMECEQVMGVCGQRARGWESLLKNILKREVALTRNDLCPSGQELNEMGVERGFLILLSDTPLSSSTGVVQPSNWWTYIAIAMHMMISFDSWMTCRKGHALELLFLFVMLIIIIFECSKGFVLSLRNHMLFIG